MNQVAGHHAEGNIQATRRSINSDALTTKGQVITGSQPLRLSFSRLAQRQDIFFNVSVGAKHIKFNYFRFISWTKKRLLPVGSLVALESSWILLLQDSLPLPQPLSDGEAGDHAVDLGSPLTHVVLNVENKRLLAKVSVHNLARGLEADGGVQVWLENRTQTVCG